MNYTHEEAIARPGSFSAFDMEVMDGFTKDLKEKQVYLEVGVQYGRSLDFVRRNSKARVYGIDIDGELFTPVEGATFICKPSNEAVKDWDEAIDVLFIDGDHTYEGCLDDWKNFSPFVKKGGWVVFHDCDETSPGVVQVFDEIGEGWTNKGKSPEQRCSMAWVQKA
jgi:hypothetical protein